MGWRSGAWQDSRTEGVLPWRLLFWGWEIWRVCVWPCLDKQGGHLKFSRSFMEEVLLYIRSFWKTNVCVLWVSVVGEIASCFSGAHSSCVHSECSPLPLFFPPPRAHQPASLHPLSPYPCPFSGSWCHLHWTCSPELGSTYVICPRYLQSWLSACTLSGVNAYMEQMKESREVFGRYVHLRGSLSAS